MNRSPWFVKAFSIFIIAIGIFLNPCVINILLNKANSNLRLDIKIFVLEIMLVSSGLALFFYYKYLRDLFTRHWKYLVFLLCFSFIASELMIRLLFPLKYPVYSSKMKYRYIVNETLSTDSELYTFSDYLPYEHRKNIDITLTDRLYGFSQHVKIDNNGLRYHKKASNSIPIMVLGDSVTFGIGVDDDDTYPAHLQDLSSNRFEVFNCGVSGWGPAEYYLAFKKTFPELRQKLVIVGLFLENDIHDMDNAVWAGKENGMLPSGQLKRKDVFIDEKNHLRTTKLLYKFQGLCRSAVFVFLWNEIFEPLSRLIANSKNQEESMQIVSHICNEIKKESGGNVIVLLIPPRVANRSDYKVTELCNLLNKSCAGIHLIDLFPALSVKDKPLYVDPWHLNKDGNRIVAEAIYKYITDNKLL